MPSLVGSEMCIRDSLIKDFRTSIDTNRCSRSTWYTRRLSWIRQHHPGILGPGSYTKNAIVTSWKPLKTLNTPHPASRQHPASDPHLSGCAMVLSYIRCRSLQACSRAAVRASYATKTPRLSAGIGAFIGRPSYFYMLLRTYSNAKHPQPTAAFALLLAHG